MLGLNRDSQRIFLWLLLVGAAEGLWIFILPVHIRSLGATPAQVGLTLSARGIAILLSFIPAGLLADRISRRKVMILLGLASVPPVLLLGFADRWQYAMLLFGLYVAGWATVPVSNSYLAQAVSEEDANRVYTTISSGFLIGLVLFPAVGAWIATRAGMRVVFLLSSLFLMLAVLPIYFLTEQPTTINHGKMDYRPIFSNRTFLTLMFFMPLLLMSLSTGRELLPNYLEEILGLTLDQIGELSTLTALGGVVLTILFGRLKDSWGLVVTQIGMISGFVLLLWNPKGFILLITVFLLGSLHPAFSLASAIISRTIPRNLSGLAFGVQGAGMGIAGIAAPILAGVLYQGAPQWPMLFSIISLTLMVIWTLRLKPATR